MKCEVVIENNIKYALLDNIGYPTYRIGIDGRVWSYKCKQGTQIKRWKVLKPWKVQSKRNPQPYLMIGLNRNGIRYYKYVHLLVLEAFVGAKPKGTEACHKNDVGVDNRLENLKYDTHKNNMKDRTNKGVHLLNTPKGSKHGMAKLTESDILYIRENINNPEDIKNKFGVSIVTGRDILNRKTWKHI